MARPPKDPLRQLTDQEFDILERTTRSITASVVQVGRARALLAVAAGSSFAQAASAAGHTTGDTVARWVRRFNEEGVSSLSPRHGGGPRRRYTEADRERILKEMSQRVNVGEGGAANSLNALRRRLQEQGVPVPSTYTLWNMLRDAGLTWHAQRGWIAGNSSRPHGITIAKVTQPQVPTGAATDGIHSPLQAEGKGKSHS